LSLKILEEMKNIDAPLTIVCYNAFLNIFKKTKDSEKAVTWLKKLEKEGPHPDAFTYGNVLTECTKF
jgi:pentatricopeptide repeat protein